MLPVVMVITNYSRTNKTPKGYKVKAKDTIIANLKYTIELANEIIIGTNSIIQGCTLNFLSHPFNIDSMPIELGSFNGDETLMIQGNRIDGYASIVASKQRAELFDRIGTKEEYEEHLRLILKLLKNKELYAKFSKCELWLPKVQFLGHIVDSQDIYGDSAKIESIKD
ncbi:hypothetical protein Tco_1472506 [Tanacetum coccineum]